MRPAFDTDVRHEGNLGHRRISFEIDLSTDAARKHIMTELTDLYTDLAGAAFREPSTNAQDSHIACGQTRPIEVTLPTDLDPTFTVRDWGVGLDVTELMENYSKYGYSTKRDNDDEAGMLGFGCKAPLTYTSQFTVTGYKNGCVVDVLVSRGEDGIGGLEPIEDSKGRVVRKTKEPNGVKVVIPIKDNRDEFIRKALFFFGFWSEGSVLVDGEEPPKHMEHESARRLDPDVVLHPGLREDYVVMGNVPYPAGYLALTSGDMQGKAIVRVPVGTVDPHPSREHLRMTPRTKEALRLANEFVRERFTNVAQVEVNACATPTEALKCIQKWNEVYRGIKLDYRGKKPPRSIEMNEWGWSYNPYNDAGGKHDEYSDIATLRALDVVWVLGYTNKTFNATHKAKLRKYFEDRNELNNSFVCFLGEKLPNPFWLQEVQVVQWDDVHSVKVAPAPKRERKPVSWEVVTTENYVRKVEDPDFKGKIVVVSGEGMYQDARTARQAFPDDVTILLLHPNRVPKFMRENKAAIELEKAVKLERQRFVNRLTSEEAEVLNTDHRTFRALAAVDADDLLDPRLARLVRAIRDVQEKKLRNRWQSLGSLAGYWNRHRYKLPESNRESRYIEAKYPLLSCIDYGVRSKHVLDYVNVMHSNTTRQEKAA